MIKYLVVFLAAVSLAAETPKEHRGNWILVNGLLVLNVGESTMTLRNSGVEAELEDQADGSFLWLIPQSAQRVRFEKGKLHLKSDGPGPKWLEYLEFRRADDALVSEVIEFALRQQNQAMASFEQIRRSSQEKAILNNLRQLGAAADQYFLEHGVATTSFDKLVGPDKYIRRMNSVDGEDYTKLEFVQGGPPWVITTDSGIEVTYEWQ